MVTSLGDTLLAEQVRLVLRASGATDWTVRTDAFWCHAQPPGFRSPEQGWKLHVSATVLSAMLVTLRAAEVLVDSGCAFKVAMGLPQLRELLSASADRRSSGKVITAYPVDEAQFVALAEELHRATEHLPGPVILSDRPVRPGSLVHCRYGGFTGRRVLSNDGSFEPVLSVPSGGLVKDDRRVGLIAPPWAPCPLPAEPPRAAGSASTQPPPKTGGPVLLAGRFVVGQAIRHATKGGVYLATDQQTGDQVVIKEARPHVGTQLDGTDVRDRLRHEATLLQRLVPFGLTPRLVLTFEQQGHEFLVEEHIAGKTLAAYAQARADVGTRGQGTFPDEELVPLARQLVTIVDTVHAQGLVVRDLSPVNLLVTPDGTVKLIDLEYMAVPGTPAAIVGTPGYTAPELDAARTASFTGIAAAPGPSADLYSLGAVLFLLVSGVDPLLGPDRPPRRAAPERLADLIRTVARDSAATRAFAPAILGLVQTDPAQRWSLARVEQVLSAVSLPAASPSAVTEQPSPPAGSGRLSPQRQDELLAGGLGWLTANLRPASERPWPTSPDASHSDPCNVQHGVGGVLAVLCAAAAADAGPALTDAARTTAGWLAERLAARSALLPGLYFGASGSLWALHDTARLLGDDELAGRALDLACTVPVAWPNPDVCHGAAGAGLGQLHLWRSTGHDMFLARARNCADGLLAAAIWRDGAVSWPIPPDFDSRLAGLTHYGFAHGTAGIGAFLLAVGQATNDQRYLRAATAAGRTLAAVTCRDGARAWWPTGQEADPNDPIRVPHWCSGSSGIGTFLVRLWRATGDDEYRTLAEAAAHTVHDSRWHMGAAHCHGIAGDGHFLLDLADQLDEPRYHAWAEQMATCLHARAAYRDGHLVVPDSSGEIDAGFGTGLAGVLSFLLRLRHGGARPFMADDALVDHVVGD